ncbi:MAG: hypothetical protein EGR19_05935 [Dialister sp.]|nr:hypothetical protein [Dialister sp.]
MNPHFFTASFYFAFIWFRVQGSRFKAQGSRFKVQGSRFKVQGSRFKVQGSRFKGEVAASPPFLEDGILVSQPSPLGCPTGADRVTMA